MPVDAPIPQPDLSQQQNPKAPPPVDPAQVRANQPEGGSNLQQILGYFESQGVTDDSHVVATVAGLPLRLSDLKGGKAAPPASFPSPPSPPSPEQSGTTPPPPPPEGDGA